jgi:prefoldin subunit 5
MTRTEILKVRLDELDKENNKLKVRVKNLYIRRQKELINVLKDWFIPFNIEDRDVTFNFTEFRVEVLRKLKDENKVIFWFSLREEWDGNTTYTGFDINKFSGGAIVNEDVVKEFFLAAKWSQFILDYQDDIVAELNMVQERYQNYIEVLRGKQQEIVKSINQQQSDIDKLEKEALTEKLTSKGFKFVKSEDGQWRSGRLPELEVRYDWTISRIKSLKVLRMSASGKSADLEITQKSNRWDEASKSYVDTDVVDIFKTVRMDKVESLLRSAKVNKQLVD